MYTYNANILRVVDGDTVTAEVDLGFSIKRKEKFRIAEFDAPESWRPKTNSERAHGNEAKSRAKELLENQEVTIKTGKQGKYGRYIAYIILPDGRDYATTMINEGFSKRDSYTDEAFGEGE